MNIFSQNTVDKRIAVNTILLMMRMGILMVLSLVAVRIVRNALGIEDYGILNAVSGFIQILVCLNSVLAISSQRFLNLALGANDTEYASNCFRVSVHLSLIIAAVAVLLLETVGLWFVVSQMNYPAERFVAVMVIYQFTILTLVSTLIQVPYLAVVMAHEKMNVFAGVTILEGVLKFALALLLFYLPWDRMVCYGIGLSLASLLSTAIYMGYTHRYFEETHSRRVTDKTLYRQMLTFTGWSLYGTVAGALMLQGNAVLLNVKIGPIANAAFAVALQIFNAIAVFGNNIVVAIKPQLTMSLGQGDHSRVRRLFRLGNVALLMSLTLIVIPLEIYMPKILTIWLGDVDGMTISFSRILVLSQAVLLMGAPITCVMQAAGYVKQYHLPVESVLIFSLPIAWLMLNSGMTEDSVCYAILLCIFLAHLVRIERIYTYYFKQL